MGDPSILYSLFFSLFYPFSFFPTSSIFLISFSIFLIYICIPFFCGISSPSFCTFGLLVSIFKHHQDLHGEQKRPKQLLNMKIGINDLELN